MSEVITAEEFAAFTPRQRGYAVYMCGSRKDQPNVPNEKNPYPNGSNEWREWNSGESAGIIEVQDLDD